MKIEQLLKRIEKLEKQFANHMHHGLGFSKPVAYKALKEEKKRVRAKVC